MLDRVREALFSTLGEVVPDARVLDLFAGTGSLGLEALSRGAECVRFVEREPRALRILNSNVETLRVEDSVDVVRGDALQRRSWGLLDDGPLADIVFLDPPYPMLREAAGRSGLFDALRDLYDNALEAGGVLVLHAHPRDLRADDVPEFGSVDRREYGNSALVYVWKPVPDAADEGDEGDARAEA